jgi:hypothetical protein
MTVKQVQWFDEHFYKIETADGTEFFPSPTTILNIVSNPSLASWRGDVGNFAADMKMMIAQAKGTRIHKAVETFLNGGKVIYQNPKHLCIPQEEFDALTAELRDKKIPYHVLEDQQDQLEAWRFQQFFEKVKPRVIGSEQIVYSLKHKYAGTTDMIFDIDKGKYEVAGAKPLELPQGRYIADLKTGNSVSDHAIEQIAAYKYAYEEMTGQKIVGGIIVHTNNPMTTKGVQGLKTIYYNEAELKEAFDEFLITKALFDKKNTKKPKVFDLPVILEMK